MSQDEERGPEQGPQHTRLIDEARRQHEQARAADPAAPTAKSPSRGTPQPAAAEETRVPAETLRSATLLTDRREEQPGDAIGPYKLLQKIGEGGFGVVWLAERRDAIVQRVALKIIKPGMDSRSVVARFEQERQALAVMDHPGVAKVFDAGTTPAGRPYFVMEHVKGEPITMFCDRNKYTIRQRLELMIPVCEAVQHAHYKGLIHRDLKPSNVLVSIVDEHAVAKVIDFGVAKAVSHTLTDKTIFTETGQLIGTPEYMSPEQAEMGATDVDTRTDVYALGVMLYELLTGALPFEPRELRSKGFAEIVRIIREVDPPRPSTRISTLGDGSKDAAGRRQTRIDELARMLRRELEWIPLKAMRKDRKQRYATPMGLATDIRRYLDGEPLEAGPESVGYRLRKIARRHAVVLSVSAAFLLLVCSASLGLGFMYLEQRRERERAERALAAEAEQRQAADAVTAFMNEVFRSMQPGRLGEALDRAAAEAGTRFRDRPLLEAGVRDALGLGYRAVSRLADGEAQLRQAVDLCGRSVGEENAQAAEYMADLAFVLSEVGKGAEATALSEKSGQILARVLGPQHPHTLAVQANRTAQAWTRQPGRQGVAPTPEETALREELALQRQVLGDDAPDTLQAIKNLAVMLISRRELAEAGQLLAELAGRVAGRPEYDPFRLDVMRAQAGLASVGGAPRTARALLEPLLEIHRAQDGESHPDTLGVMCELTVSEYELGNLARAEALISEAVGHLRQAGAADPAALVNAQNLLATILLERGAVADAEKVIQRTRKTVAAVPDINRALALYCAGNEVALLRARRDWAEAERRCRELLEARRERLGESHPHVLRSLHDLGTLLCDQGRHQEAEPYLQQAVDAAPAVLAVGHWRTGAFELSLGECLIAQGKQDEAQPRLIGAYRTLRSALGDEHPLTRRAQVALGEAPVSRQGAP